MRFDRIKIRNLGPFGEVDLDLAELPGKVLAVAGANGEGKSTLIELLAGAAYRSCATRGPLAKLATSRDASVEVSIVNGRAWTIRQSVDGLSGKGETLILDDTGRPVIESAKVSEADAWVKAHLPAPQVLYSSSVAVQGSRGFLGMKPSERKAMLVRLLDLEKLERQAEEARVRAREAKERAARYRELRAEQEQAAGIVQRLPGYEVRLAEGRLTADDRAAPTSIDDLRARVIAFEDKIAEADQRVDDLELALSRARAAAEDAQRAAELAAQRRAVARRLADAEEKLADVQRRIANNRGVLDRADEIRAAEARAVELDEQAGQHAEAARAAELDQHRAEDAARAVLKESRGVAARVAEAEGRARRADERLQDEEAIRDAAGRADALRRTLTGLEGEQETARAELARLQDKQLNGKDERLGTMRGGVTEIRDGAEDPSNVASDVLFEDDRAIEDAKALPAEIQRVQDEIRRVGDERVNVSRGLVAAEKLAARAGEMEAAREDKAAAEADIAKLQPERDALQAQAAEHKAVREAALARYREAATKRNAVRDQRAEIDPVIELAGPLAQVETRLEAYAGHQADLDAAIARARTELADLPAADESDDGPDIAARERTLREAKQAAQELRELRGRARAAIETAEQAAAKAKVHAARQAEAEEQTADWTRLAQDLGRDGLQAMEIDAAVPELNLLTNEFLRDCHGTRFTVEVKTDRLSADGKRTLEGLDVRVLDNENGRDDLAETYSGGECVIVGEAIALALTMMACHRSGIQNPSLVRDETAGALDETNTRAYIAMLRKAAEMTDAAQVLFVSHSAEARELADARIVVADGKVEVQA